MIALLSKKKKNLCVGYLETQRSFHAKTKCDSRIYEYLFPAYALKQLEPEKKWTHTRQTEKDVQISTEDGTLIKYMAPTDPKKLFDYRVENERLNKFCQAMSMFQGTHNFHNYTIARSFHEPAAKRYMIDINVSEPMMIQGMQWISVKLHGQSFMLHQIRKMICKCTFLIRMRTLKVDSFIMSFSYGYALCKNRYSTFTHTQNIRICQNQYSKSTSTWSLT